MAVLFTVSDEANMMLFGQADVVSPAWQCTSVGDAVLSGTADTIYIPIFNYSPNDDGMLFSGDSIISRDAYAYTPDSSSISFSGTSVAIPRGSIKYEAVGSELSLSSDTGITGHFNLSEQFQWAVKGTITVSKAFYWNIGRAIWYYYRVEGRCITNFNCESTGVDLGDSNCTGTNNTGQSYVQVVAARGTGEVCAKLLANNLGKIWPVSSIKKYTRPMYKGDIVALQNAGIDQSCNKLIDVSFCNSPECFQLCSNFSQMVSIGAKSFLKQAIHLPEASTLSLHLSSGMSTYTITVPSNFVRSFSGTATALCSYHECAALGSIDISGDAGIVSQAFTVADALTLSISGTAPTEPTIFRYSAICDLIFSGISEASVKLRCQPIGGLTFKTVVAAATVIKNFSYTGNGQLGFGTSSFTVTPNWYVYTGEGGLTLTNISSGTSVRSSSFSCTGEGQITFAANSLLIARYASYLSSGVIRFAGTSMYGTVHEATGFGQINLSGATTVSSPFWSYTGTGPIVIGGTSIIGSSYIGSFITRAGAKAFATTMESNISDSTSVVPLTASTAAIETSCGCGDMPNVLWLSHNLARSNSLQVFLDRNRLTLPSSIELRYNRGDQTWRNNIQYRGIGPNDLNEVWTLLFEWGCVNSDFGNTWRFSFFARRVLGGDNYETRILYLFDSNAMCVNNKPIFNFSINTITGEPVQKNWVFATSSVFNDEIGLFKGKSWLLNRNLDVNITFASLSSNVQRMAISSIFPS